MLTEAENRRRMIVVEAGIKGHHTRAGMADALGITVDALKMWAKKRGIDLPTAYPKVAPVPDDPAEMRELFSVGFVRCGVHGVLPREGGLQLSVSHNRQRLRRILLLHSECHLVEEDE